MFLGVSDSVRHVDMNDSQRANFAKWLLGIQRSKFADNAKAAYTYAGVNSGTWTRAVTAQTLKPRSVAKIVNAFRADAEGDWTKLGLEKDAPAVSTSDQDEPGYVSGPGPKADGGDSEDRVLNAIEQMRQDVQAMEQRLSERLDRLEGGS